MEITKRIEEALKAESEESSKREEVNKEFSSNGSNQVDGYHSYDSKNAVREQEEKPAQHSHSKSEENDINLNSLKDAYEDYMEEVIDLPSEPEKKAR